MRQMDLFMNNHVRYSRLNPQVLSNRFLPSALKRKNSAKPDKARAGDRAFIFFPPAKQALRSKGSKRLFCYMLFRVRELSGQGGAAELRV